MKIYALVIAALIGSNSYAGTETNSSQSMDTDAPASAEYQVASKKSFMIDGRSFVKFELQQKDAFAPPAPAYEFNNSQIQGNRDLILGNMLVTGIAAVGVLKVNPKQDKVRHILAGYVIANVSTGALQLFLPKTMKHRKLISMLGGFGTAVLVGIGKEYRDSLGYGHAEVNDALATALGGLGGSVVISIGDVSKAFHKLH